MQPHKLDPVLTQGALPNVLLTPLKPCSGLDRLDGDWSLLWSPSPEPCLGRSYIPVDPHVEPYFCQGVMLWWLPACSQVACLCWGWSEVELYLSGNGIHYCLQKLLTVWLRDRMHMRWCGLISSVLQTITVHSLSSPLHLITCFW